MKVTILRGFVLIRDRDRDSCDVFVGQDRVREAWIVSVRRVRADGGQGFVEEEAKR